MNVSGGDAADTQVPHVFKRRRKPAWAARKNFSASMRPDRRCTADEWLARSQHLPEGDRVLIEEAVDVGFNAERLAKTFHMSKASVFRHLRRIKRTLKDPCFLLAANFGDCLPTAMQPVARGYFIEGLPMRACATRYGLTLHQVRQMITVMRSMLILKEAPVAMHTRRAIERSRAVQLSALNIQRAPEAD